VLGGGDAVPSTSAEPPIIEGVTPISVDSRNVYETAKSEFKKLRDRIKQGLVCPALDGRRVAGTISKHLKNSKGKKRNIDDVVQRVSLMPYIIPIIERGMHTETRNDKNGASYKITGRVSGVNADKNVSVILVEDPKTRLLYCSIFYDTTKNVSKSLTQVGGSFPTAAYFDKSSRHREQGLTSLNHGFIIPNISAVSIGTGV
jgi:hypothetical protein